MRKIYWLSVRLWLFFLFFLLLLTGGLSVILLYPFYAWLFVNNLSISRNVKFIIPTIKTSYLLVFDLITKKAYHETFPIQITSAPMMAPDANKSRIRHDWPIADGTCNGCTKCCLARKCPLLSKNHQCLAYGSLYWRYFNCGRYPENQKQIDWYGCPKWEIRHG